MIKKHPTLGILVSDTGEVQVKKPGRSKEYRWSSGSFYTGYMHVCINGKQYAVHRLVAETFIGPRPDGMEIDHIDRDSKHNSSENLRYVNKTVNRNNRDDVDRTLAAIGCHQRDNRSAYNRFYANTERGKESRRKGNLKYWSTHRSVRFSDGRTHAVPEELADTLLALKPEQRIWGESHEQC